MISALTILTIQENGAEVATYQGKNNQYGFEIYCTIREHYRPQVSSDSVFCSRKQAKDTGKITLKGIQDLDLTKKKKEISDLLGPAAEPVQKIIDASKK